MSTKKTKATKKTDDTPSLVSLIATAGIHYGKSLQSLLGFAETYVLAVSLYGQEAKKEFRTKWPLYTDATWGHIEAIGKHNLLPFFFLSSDAMISGILRLDNSMEKQLNLVAATKDGKIETVSAKGTVVLKSLSELTKIEELGIVFAMSKATSAEEIRKYAYEYRKEWAHAKSKPLKPDYEKIGDFLKVNHAIKQINKEDWLSMGRLMGWTV